jgi:ferredoxin-NADP reductase
MAFLGSNPLFLLYENFGVAFVTDALILPLGIVLVGLVATKLGIMSVAALRRLAQQNEQAQLAGELLRLKIAEAKKRQKQSTLAWNGYRKFVIDRKVEEACDICSFYLVPHDQKSLPHYKPGQYLTFRLNIPGRDKPIVRCYSISDRPSSSDYRVTIKRVRPPRDEPNAPPGLVSSYFHEQLSEGDILDVQAPRGQFFIEPEKERPAVLIAGGVGVTPLLSMAQTIAKMGSGREIMFFYGVRNGTEHAFKNELEQLTKDHDNVRLVVAYSKPTGDDEAVEGQAYQHVGRIDIELIKSYLQSTNYEFYICGPAPMMETLNQKLAKWGVAKQDIKMEAFGPATVSRARSKPADAAAKNGGSEAPATCQVTFARTGKKCDWSDKAGNLLDFASANGVEIESGCRAGNCGTCVIAIKSGKVSYVTDHGAELEVGTCLTCIAAPDGDLVIDA